MPPELKKKLSRVRMYKYIVVLLITSEKSKKYILCIRTPTIH